MTETSQQRRNDLICLCLALVTLAVYWPVRHFQFVSYDDGTYVYLNPPVRAGVTLDGLAWAFTTNHEATWHPLTWISHMLDCQLFGLDAGAHHLVNVVIHIASTLVLFYVLNRMTAAPWRSAFVAALFAWHPLHVESVAWVAERKDVLSAFFWMLTLWAYVRYVEQFKVRGSKFNAQQPPPYAFRSPLSAFYGLALLFFALGLMAKPMLVTLPFVMLLLDYWPLGRTRWAKPVIGERLETPFSRLVKEKLPFLALAAVSSIVTVWAQSGGAISSLEALPLGTRLENAVVAYRTYLGKTFWPSGLAVFYPYPTWPLGVIVISSAVLIGVSVFAIWRGRRNPQFLVGWLWFLGTLVPVIGLVQVGGQSLADRYAYLPLVGLFLMAGWSVPNNWLEQSLGRKLAAGTAVALLCAYAVVGRIQVSYWENSETLFRHALAVTKNNWLAHYNLGVNLMQQGRLDDAIEHYKQAVQIRPNYFEAHNNMAFALRKAGRSPEAIAHWEQALRTWSNNAEVHSNLGLALLQAGKAQDAIGHFEQALRIKPDAAAVHYNFGLALEQTGKIDDAIKHYEQAIQLKPDLVQAQNSLTRLQASR